MSDVDYPVNDFDNHYYEALDAFTRHLDPKLGRRIIQWAEIDGRKYHVIGGKVSHAVVNPTFDPIAKAGAMAEYFRGNPSGRNPLDYLREREPIRREYRDRETRIQVMDEQGLDKIWLYPTLGMIYEQLLKHDPEGVGIMFRAFNRWIEDDWGYNFENRIFTAPYITLADRDVAIEELERALGLGATTIVMRPAAPTTIWGPLTPGDPYFDPFWARVNEAGITVVVHAGDSGYSLNGYAKEGFSAEFSGSGRPSIGMMSIERAIYDFLASLVFDQLFDRFPNLRVASVENGAEFLPDLFRKFKSINRKIPGLFKEDPVETFRRHIWINPFWEDDPYEIVDLMGADRVVFGSDWPHIEGLPNPRDYAVEIKELDPESQRLIMHDNAEVLNTLQPI
jgi:predicted TIM-barrel fold metal-dependent hydrolase